MYVTPVPYENIVLGGIIGRRDNEKTGLRGLSFQDIPMAIEKGDASLRSGSRARLLQPAHM